MVNIFKGESSQLIRIEKKIKSTTSISSKNIHFSTVSAGMKMIFFNFAILDKQFNNFKGIPHNKTSYGQWKALKHVQREKSASRSVHRIYSSVFFL